jgi:hypothetical protein
MEGDRFSDIPLCQSRLNCPDEPIDVLTLNFHFYVIPIATQSLLGSREMAWPRPFRVSVIYRLSSVEAVPLVP